MGSKSQKAFAALLAFALFAVGCTKQRQASLPDGLQEAVFAISEFGDLQTEKNQFKIQTDDSVSRLGLGDSSKATAEKGLVALEDAEVPSRLKYMFLGLEITGQADRSYPLTFSVDKQFVTAYKVVNDPSELTILEKRLAQVKEEVVLQKQLQKTKDLKKSKALLASLNEVRSKKQTMLSQRSAAILVPLFKFKVQGFGVLQRAKNDLKEETSVLQLKPSEWADATHIQISINSADRMPVGLDPASRGELDRTFVMDRINNKIMTAETLGSEYQIALNLDKNTRVLTLLDVDALHVFEVSQIGKADLTDSQLRQLKIGPNKGNIRNCPADVVNALPADARKNCILVLRYDVPVTYVSPELPVVDYDGNQQATVQFKPVRSNENIGLVQIPQNVEPKKVVGTNELDPNTTIRISDIKNKEFFFRRTVEEASISAGDSYITPGMSGAIAIAKFDFEENRVVLRNVERVINIKKGLNDLDYEELMSLPVHYKKLETKDATGAAYSVPRLVDATRNDAQYIEVDWTGNTIPQDASPYSSLYQGCTIATANAQVVDMDMRLVGGVLNFSQQYTFALRPECMVDFNRTSTGYDISGGGYQYTARVKERISLKVNDGSTDKAFVKEIPFAAQNVLGFGVWTRTQITPNEMGQVGIDGTEKSMPMVHDFRNGKKLVYTLAGLPTDDPEERELYIGIVRELVKSWNFAYQQAFKGSALERNTNYIELEINGENGLNAHVGDLDKNIFLIVTKASNDGTLGVSQVGYNPRSAVVVADSLVLYGGNVKSDVARSYRQMTRRAEWEKKKKEMRDNALARLKEQEAADEKAKKGETPAPTAPTQEKAAVANAVARQIIDNVSKGKSVAPVLLANARSLKMNSSEVKQLLKQKKSLGTGSFAYSAPTAEYGWMDKVLRVVTSKPDITVTEIQGAMAKELLAAKGARMTEAQRAGLERVVRRVAMKERVAKAMRVNPGCMQTEAETANSFYATLTFKEAFRIEALNTMVHEMGHSQGLTHNFMGSIDKKNYANEDGTASKRNYSSVMDYLTPGKFAWDGVGTYDIRAIRASHLGLFEASDETKQILGGEVLVNGKFVTLEFIKERFRPSATWVGFKKADLQGLLKDYKYCTDIDVGEDPACQRHDFGSSATEVVLSIINDIEDNYVSNYYGWDNLTYDDTNAWIGSAWTSHFLTLMRKYMDETFYKAFVSGTDEEVNDYATAAIIAYQYYHQLIRTPDADAGGFMDPNRMQAIAYEYDERDAEGNPTGKKIKDVAIIEKRQLQSLSETDKRYDTYGIEFDKITALEMLTMKGYPASRYRSASLDFSFMEFEKYVLGVDPSESRTAGVILDILMNDLTPTFSTDKAKLRPIADMTASVTPAMRAYAGIYGILNLEGNSLKDEDNYATLFKVGRSFGKGPSDRPVLNQLGVSPDSKARIGYWALDNALVSKTMVETAARKNTFIQMTPVVGPLMDAMIVAQLKAELSRMATKDHTPDPALLPAIDAAKTALYKKLTELNAKGEIVTPEEVKEYPMLALAMQVEQMSRYSTQVIQVTLGLLTDDGQEAQAAADELRDRGAKITQGIPLFGVLQTTAFATLKREGAALAETNPDLAPLAKLGQQSRSVLNVNILENSYGIILKNLEFLSSITAMTNPEYAR